MPLLNLILILAIVGVVAWLVLQLPMPQPFKTAIVALMTIGIIVYLLQVFGLLPSHVLSLR